MNRWIGKTAIVTGASSGIGAAIAVELVKAGMIVIGAARRQERVDQLKTDIPDAKKVNLHSFKCDVSKEADIKALFKWVDEKFGGVDVLINNAGIMKAMNLLDADNTDKIKEILDVNVVAAALCCREAYQSMRKKGVDDGHIVLINSINGHKVVNFANKFPSLNIYTSSKYAITAMTEVLRQELQVQKTKIKITSISPGVVDTEFIGENSSFIKTIPHLESKDIADAVLYVLGTPPHVQVHEIILRPIGEIF